MHYGKFITYNIVGGVLWVLIATLAGYFFGNIPIVKDNFSLVIFAIIFISILPMVYEALKHKLLNHPIIHLNFLLFNFLETFFHLSLL